MDEKKKEQFERQAEEALKESRRWFAEAQRLRALARGGDAKPARVVSMRVNSIWCAGEVPGVDREDS